MRSKVASISTIGRSQALIVIVWIAHACPCLGQPSVQATAVAPTPLQPGQIDTQRSRTFVRVGATGLGHEHGAEGRLASGSLRLGIAQQAGELVFDMRSFVCDTPAARQYVSLQGTIDDSTQQKTTANMIGADVLDVARFPQAKFVIRSSLPFPKKQPTDPQWYQLDGDFTLHGVTRPLKINVVAEPNQGMLHVRGEFTVLQSQYGITPYSKAFGAIGVADELKIWGDLWIGGQ